MDYRLDVNSEAAHKSMDLFLSDLDLTLNARVKAYRYLWDNFNWQLFMLVFTGTDRLMHFLWDAYEDENNIYHDKFLEHFKKIDKVIGEIASRMGKEDILIMLSDHGFEKLELDIYINYVLKKEGFLQFKDSQDHDFSNIGHSTKAFALDPARIYINLKDKYPDGGVDILERDRILQDLILLFKELELNGNKVIKDVYRKEDIYKGEYFDSAPDLVLLGNKGFNLKGNIKANKLYDKAIFTGKHSYDNAFFMLKGNNNCLLPDNLAVYDVKRIIEAV
jgi:predicted AlkP superfamily phosphohydrolase/phosphomutase